MKIGMKIGKRLLVGTGIFSDGFIDYQLLRDCYRKFGTHTTFMLPRIMYEIRK